MDEDLRMTALAVLPALIAVALYGLVLAAGVGLLVVVLGG